MNNAREVSNAGYKAWADHDIDGMMALIAEDAVFRGPGEPGGHTVRGHAAIRAMANEQMAAWPDERLEIRRQVVEGDFVVTELVSTSTHKGEVTLATGEKVAATGRTIVQKFVEINHVVDGKVVECTSYYDRHDLLRQLGQLEGALATAT
jgi:steroid delta-isomerase-like uncharacterized protein